MWEKIIAIGTVVLIILTSILVWQGFNRPPINWYLLATVGIVALALMIAGILNFKAAQFRVGGTPVQHEDLERPVEERHIWFYSPGICVSLERATKTVIVNLHILSTWRTELSFIRVELRDAFGKFSITSDNSEPIIIERLNPSNKTIKCKLNAEEVTAFPAGGAMLIVSGIAKFRDGGRMQEQSFELKTIAHA